MRERLGDMDALPSAADNKLEIARAMQAKMEAFRREVAENSVRQEAEAVRTREALKRRQQGERNAFEEAAKLRRESEHRERESRLRTGLLGLWDRIRGERRRILERNAREAAAAQRRDKSERDRLVAAQLAQRRELIRERRQDRDANRAVVGYLTEDARVFDRMAAEAESERKARLDALRERPRPEDRPRRRSRHRGGPALER